MDHVLKAILCVGFPRAAYLGRVHELAMVAKDPFPVREEGLRFPGGSHERVREEQA
jgi:hypothetical protein